MRGARWVVLWSLWATRLQPPRTADLVLAGGAVSGRLAADGSHARYCGIPYASVPRRFQAPGAAPRWSGVLRAENEHVRCTQRWPPFGALGAEDCLRLNVYAPEPRAAAALPVMVFVHGGGFFEGSGSRLLYGPEYLVARGVVLVTFNYRLGAPGFACLGTRAVPGNAGMKDQVAALRWVRDNVAAFGGDPGDVTMFGESAGAVSVSCHLASPMSRGLFRRAIVQSGSALAQWALQADGAEAAALLARGLGHDVRAHDAERLGDILASAPVADLFRLPTPRIDGGWILQRMPYAPCVERQIDGVEAFLTEHPRETLARGDHARVPVVIGFNDREGYFFAAMEEDAVLYGEELERRLPERLCFPTRRARAEATRELRRRYGLGGGLRAAGAARLARYYGAAYVEYPVAAQARLLARAAPVYAYRLVHAGWRNFAKLYCGPRYWLAPGAAHADDLFYLFSVFPVPALFEGAMIRTLTTMWTDFAKHGYRAFSFEPILSGEDSVRRVATTCRLHDVARDDRITQKFEIVRLFALECRKASDESVYYFIDFYIYNIK